MKEHLVRVAENGVVREQVEVSSRVYPIALDRLCPDSLKLGVQELESDHVEGCRHEAIIWPVHIVQLGTAVLHGGDDPRQIGKRLVEVENADRRALFGEPHLVLGLDGSVVEEDRVALLDLDEGDILV